MPDCTEKYYVRCFAKHEDRKAKIKKVAVGVGTSAIAVARGTSTFGSKVLDVAKKSKVMHFQTYKNY